MQRFNPWRALFVLAGALIVAGGIQHPRGPMVEMLADPAWVRSHLLVLAGFAALLIGLILYRRDVALPSRTERWSRWAVIGSALMVVEMIFHTASSVDQSAYAAGESAPILTIHLFMATVFYPAFSIAMIGLIWVGARERALGSMAIGWLGILGAAAHGLAPILVLVLRMGQFAILFPMVMLLALWLVLAAFWPIRVGVHTKERAGVAT